MPISTEELRIIRDLEGQQLIFEHRYEPPRGKVSVPIALSPGWFPVTPILNEQINLAQIIYRMMASSREPFRRSQIVCSSENKLSSIYSLLLRGTYSSEDAPISTIGVSLLKATSGYSGSEPIEALYKLIERGSDVELSSAIQLTQLVIDGNAWLVIKDDVKGKAAKLASHILSVLFEHSSLSHVPILILSKEKKRRFLRDIQIYVLAQYKDQTKSEFIEKSANLVLTRKTTAFACRVLESLGSYSVKVLLPTIVLFTIAVLVLLLLQFENWMLPTSFSDVVSQWNVLPKLVSFPLFTLFFSFLLANILGIGWGSEELRFKFVNELTIPSFFCTLTALIVPLPMNIASSLIKNILLVIVALPYSALIGFITFMWLSVLADTIWLIISMNIGRNLNKKTITELAREYQVNLHPAIQNVHIQLPVIGSRNKEEYPRLPLLLCEKEHSVLGLAIESFPRLIPIVSKTTLAGLRKMSLVTGGYSTGSLLIAAINRNASSSARRCLELIAEECIQDWKNNVSWPTGMGWSGIEIVMRNLLFISDIEKMVVMN